LKSVALTDSARHDFGVAQIEDVQGNLLIGEFSPGPDYPSIEPLFRHLADVIEQQSFSFLDAAEQAIAALKLTIREGSAALGTAHDVQISPDGGFSCRLVPDTERNGRHPQ
jgi:hypothetical protein